MTFPRTTRFSGNVAFNNSQNGLYILYANNTTITDMHLYNNVHDFALRRGPQTAPSRRRTWGFDNPSGVSPTTRASNINDSVAAAPPTQ